MPLSYLKLFLKSGNPEELLSSSFCSLVGSLMPPSLLHIRLKKTLSFTETFVNKEKRNSHL
jgi:hypothetical protein